MKACFGHTEGAAGIHGAMLAVLAVQQLAAPAIMHLRGLNAYVSTAIADWKTTCNLTAAAPKASSPTTCVPRYAREQPGKAFQVSKRYILYTFFGRLRKAFVSTKAARSEIAALAGRGCTANDSSQNDCWNQLFWNEWRERARPLHKPQGSDACGG